MTETDLRDEETPEASGVDRHVMPVFQLDRGDIFLLRKNGRPYCFHCRAIESPEGTNEHYDHFILAYGGGRLYAFYSDKKIIKVEKA